MSGGFFFLFLSIAIIAVADAIPLKRECRQSSMDVFFLMDSSSSIQTENFADQLKFVADVVNNLDMKVDGIHAGLATFSDSFYLSIDLTHDKNSFLSLMSSIFPLSGSTRIGRALTYLKSEGFGGPLARKNATKVAILITDGESVDNPFPVAEELKTEGVKIFAIEAKRVNNKGELRQIASKPSYRFLLKLDARNVGDAIAKTISKIGCNSPEIRDNCQQMQNQDFRFLIDLAGFGRLKSNQIMKFTIRAVRMLERKQLNCFFGIHFSSRPTQGVIKIPSVSNVTALIERFDHLQFPGPQGIVSSFLRYPERFQLLKNRKKMIVVFVDESSEPLEELISEVDKFRLKDKYAVFFIIAIGTTVNKDQAKEIASDKSLYLHFPDINNIENNYEDFIDLLCNPQDYNQDIIFGDID